MRWIGVAAAVAALALAAAGCGSSSDSSTEAAGDTAVTETSSATDTSSATEETSTETTSTETTSTETTSAETNGNLAGLTGECKDLAEAGQKFGAAISSSANGGNSDLQVTADAFKEFVAQAPDELKDDFQVLAKVIAVYAAALKDIDLKAGSTPTPAQIAKLTKLGQSLNSADVQKASTAIAAWSQEHCGATP
jgi:hypothetical protein